MARALRVVDGEEPAPRNAKEALHAAEMTHLECRDLRHPWSVVGLFYAHTNGRKEVHRKLVCQRCGTEATDRWTPGGSRVARQYKYVPGYSVHGVKIKPQDVRREVMQRVEVYANEDDMLASLFSRRGRKRA